MKYGVLQKFVTFGEYEHLNWLRKQAAQLPKGTRVLDVGAGTCRFRALFRHCDYQAHDFAQLSSDVTQYGKLDYVSDILSIPVGPSSFDAIVCTQVLEHVAEPIRAVAEFSRILKPGGVLILSAPQRSGLHQSPYHFYGGYTKYWYEKFLPEAGFILDAVLPNGGFFKHYGEAGHQFVSFLFPNAGKRRFWRVYLFPLFLALKVFALLQAMLCHYLDPLDESKDMTVGYHVRAIKR